MAVVGHLAAATRLHVTVVLKVPHPAALLSFVNQVSDPSSPLYRDYVTPAEFGSRFGASQAELQRVTSRLRAHGLVPGMAAANRLSIPVTATAGQIERAFRLSFNRVVLEHGIRGVTASAPPAVDPQIAPDVQAVLGLNTLATPHPLLERPSRSALLRHVAEGPHALAHVATGGPQPCPEASQAATRQSAYTADQIASAYGFSGLYAAGDQGQGQTIAIYELEPNDPADVAAYQACYGTHASISYVPVAGGVGSGAGAGEATLDIENAIGLAPRANYLVYQGPNAGQSVPGSGPYETFSAIINQDRANVVSVSWGECEQLEGSSGAQAESTLFEQAAAQGQSIVSASGDNGSEDCNGAGNVPNPKLAVDDPSSQPFVTGVGGTSMSQLGPPPTQTVWNNGGNVTGLIGLQPGAGGGGISSLWGMPGYQSSAAGSVHVINGASSGSSCGASHGDCRQSPDVAADADPNTGYLVYYNGSGQNATAPQGWQGVGGTSAAAPVWAALLALIDASAACGGSPVGFANPALYKAAATGYANDFTDVTSGNNDFTGTNGGMYGAGVGYDMATGLGTPNATALAAALCANALRVRDPGTQTTLVGQSVSLKLATTGVLSGTATWVGNSLPPGLTLSRYTGLITGKPKRAGSFVPAVVVLDSALSIRGIAFDWNVLGSPTVSNASISGAGGGRPKLQMTLSAGKGAPGLQKLLVALPTGLSFTGARVKVTGADGRRIASHARLSGGRLALTLPSAPLKVTLTIAYPAITTTGAISSQIRGHRSPALVLTVTASDAQHHTVSLKVRVRARS
jgi:subtilase family serine protease